jgi:hypothetical protein
VEGMDELTFWEREGRGEGGLFMGVDSSWSRVMRQGAGPLLSEWWPSC